MKNSAFETAIAALESYGVELTVNGIRTESENAYAKGVQANGTNYIHVSDDLDMSDIFEDGRPEGMKVESVMIGQDFGKPKHMVTLLTF